MKYLPIEYKLFLVALLAFLFLTGIYAIADGASGQLEVTSAKGNTLASSESIAGASTDGLDWYQEAAIYVCPLH